MARSVLIALTAAALVSVPCARAHAGHGHGPKPEELNAPIDFWLGLHIALEALSWAVLFPLAMVLGLVRHRLHVPLAASAVAVSLFGFVLGSHHGGRKFKHTVHGTNANLMLLSLLAQAVCGIYLKLHLQWAPEKYVRPVVLRVHGVLGRAYPVLGWVQMVFGVATLQRWCNGGHLGQCLAHYIMGSAFAAYSVILLIMLKAAVSWLNRTGRSQEFIDSWVILLWGIVNTFTEHQGGPWTHKDLQHTTMGVIWWAGGAAGVWVSRKGKRSAIPGCIIVLTGWSMSGHKQAVPISTMVHALFGYVLMAAGVCRIIEVCFVLHDQPTGTNVEPAPGAWFGVYAFQYLPPLFMACAGTLFMSATDEEMRWADSLGVDHVTWGLIGFSFGFLIFLWANVLIDTYVGYGGHYGLAGARPSLESPSGPAAQHGNGHSLLSYVRLPSAPWNGASQEARPEHIAMDRHGEQEPHVLFDDHEPADEEDVTAKAEA